VALHPKYNFRWPVVDASNDLPVKANFELQSSDGNYLLQSTTDSACCIVGTLDDRLSYQLRVNADNYEPYAIDMEHVFDNNFVVRLIPINLKTFVLQNMYFATAQTTILPSSKPSLDLLYDLLSENPELVIRIVGHTDDVGTEQSNQVLSEGRARSIYQEMVNRGIDAKRIQTAGKGELKPLVPNTSDANRQMNRRVEIEIISGADNVNIERLTK
jgi:outer membrane protein OmpA-like peptidoglycan-associated protein